MPCDRNTTMPGCRDGAMLRCRATTIPQRRGMMARCSRATLMLQHRGIAQPQRGAAELLRCRDNLGLWLTLPVSEDMRLDLCVRGSFPAGQGRGSPPSEAALVGHRR